MATFSRSGLCADAHQASTIRREFDGWLRTELHMMDVQRSDVTLAVYEAVANAVEHAYYGSSKNRTVELVAEHDDRSDVLAVTVSDCGTWRSSVPESRITRGRGIALMEALADHVSIDTSCEGTQACLHFRFAGTSNRLSWQV